MNSNKALFYAKSLWAMRCPSYISLWLHDKFNRPYRKTELKFHLIAAIDWLCSAHDICGQEGVSAMYSFLRGWFPPYPETTGYIIPTFLKSASLLGREDLHSRAIMMADWEVEIQMENGSYQGMYWTSGQGTQVKPAVFNTGQIILGLIKAFEVSGKARYKMAFERAANYLLSIQETDGSWRKHLGPATNASVYSYNSRVGFALILAGKSIGKNELIRAGEKNIEWTISQQKDNGWFYNAAFIQGNRPLTHTLCYCIEGILEAGLLLDNKLWIEKACLSADQMMTLVDKKGLLPATLDDNWQSPDTYQCVTGNCQIALIWLLLYKATGSIKYYYAADRMIDFLIGLQNIDSKNIGIRGGIKSSHPISGGYIPFAMLNWANKFFIDLLLLKIEVDNSASRDSDSVRSNQVRNGK